jgi:hypothetical protein
MDTLELPREEAVPAAVGHVAIRHGQLTHILKMTVKSILGISVREALDGTGRQSFRELKQRVRHLAKQRIGEGPALTRLDALLQRSQLVTDRRNDFIHSLWSRDAQGNPMIRDDEHQGRRIPSAALLNELAEEIHDIAADLNYARLEGFLADALRARSSKSQAGHFLGLSQLR